MGALRSHRPADSCMREKIYQIESWAREHWCGAIVAASCAELRTDIGQLRQCIAARGAAFAAGRRE
jgi:hypothetical protein